MMIKIGVMPMLTVRETVTMVLIVICVWSRRLEPIPHCTAFVDVDIVRI